MNTYIDSIKQICEFEEKQGLYDFTIGKMPIWSSVYRVFRDKYINETSGVPPMENHAKFHIKDAIVTTFKSAIQYIKYISGITQVDNIIYGFARLEHIDGIYIDKFCDELINKTNLSKSYLYLERSRSSRHLTPRALSNILWIEFIDNFSLILGRVISPIVYVANRKKFDAIMTKCSEIMDIKESDKRFIANKVSMDLLRLKLTLLLFRRTKAKRVFATTMRNKAYLMVAAKILNIPCYEIQHGITEGPTPMYSGKYLTNLSPTAFLAFGETSMKPVFNVPIHKMINIGFAYKEFLKSKSCSTKSSSYLFVSDPEITQELIDVACNFKKLYSHIDFAIRFHPMEKPTNLQIEQLNKYQIRITDNTENSSLAVMHYEGIIGEKSSVLYEALSLGIKSGKIYFSGLNIGIDENEELNKGFFILKDLWDFDKFKQSTIEDMDIPEFYSDFQPDQVNNLLL